MSNNVELVDSTLIMLAYLELGRYCAHVNILVIALVMDIRIAHMT